MRKQYTYTAVSLRLNDEHDADIIAFLQGQRKQTLIKYLIREHMRQCGIPRRPY